MQKRANAESVKKLRKKPKFYVFSQCLDKYGILDDLDKAREYTFFIPENGCFLKDIKTLDPMGDKKIKEIFKAHIVPQKLTNLRVNHSYATLQPNKLIKVTKPKTLNNKAEITEGPTPFNNLTVYCINEVLY